MPNNVPIIHGRITIEKQQQIVELTGKADRPEIADKLGISATTVFHYQKLFKII
mgnify:CR=1 FL=1